MKINTSRFGRLKIERSKLIFFKSGIPGFENLNKFVLLPQGDSGVYFWLQSVENPDVAFLVVNPFIFFPDYDIEIPEADVCELELNNLDQILVFVIITIPPEDIRRATVNLLAPVIINTQNKKGKQVVLEGTRYTTRHLLFVGNGDQKRNNNSESNKRGMLCRGEKDNRHISISGCL